MNNHKLRGKLIGFGMSLFLFYGFGFLLTTGTYAQFRDNRQIRRDGRYDNRGQLNRIAQARGHNQGLREGAKDARSRKRHQPYGKGKYKKATDGYNSRLGNKEAYKLAYRNAFLRGYSEAFYRPDRGYRGNRGNRRGW